MPGESFHSHLHTIFSLEYGVVHENQSYWRREDLTHMADILITLSALANLFHCPTPHLLDDENKTYISPEFWISWTLNQKLKRMVVVG
jgi:hypothetical protein